MSKTLQAVRGMRDVLPDQSALWQHVEDVAREVLVAYGYREIRVPLLEKTELFRRSIGTTTDIVEKEMYTFEDRNGDSLTLRPEGTAGCVRAGIENGILYNQVQRLWYTGPMFRHERPQKGRYRQFYQVGAETFGLEGPDIDVEHILMTARMWRLMGLEDLRLELNTLGTPDARAAYREALIEYFEGYRDSLDEDSQRRLHTNPLRILDSKNPELRDIIAEAPSLFTYLDDASREHFDSLCGMLDDAGIEYQINPRLVRGLDYYTKTVFEWITDQLGAQGTVCAGGRYDGLVQQLGGRETPAVGFALGTDRLVGLLDEQAAAWAQTPHVYLVTVGDTAQRRGLMLAERLRDRLSGLRLVTHCGGGSFKSQLKRADRSGAQIAVLLGDDELARGVVGIKPLRENTAQWEIPEEKITGQLQDIFGKGIGGSDIGSVKAV